MVFNLFTKVKDYLYLVWTLAKKKRKRMRMRHKKIQKLILFSWIHNKKIEFVEVAWINCSNFPSCFPFLFFPLHLSWTMESIKKKKVRKKINELHLYIKIKEIAIHCKARGLLRKPNNSNKFWESIKEKHGLYILLIFQLI